MGNENDAYLAFTWLPRDVPRELQIVFFYILYICYLVQNVMGILDLLSHATWWSYLPNLVGQYSQCKITRKIRGHKLMLYLFLNSLKTADSDIVIVYVVLL